MGQQAPFYPLFMGFRVAESSTGAFLFLAAAVFEYSGHCCNFIAVPDSPGALKTRPERPGPHLSRRSPSFVYKMACLRQRPRMLHLAIWMRIPATQIKPAREFP